MNHAAAEAPPSGSTAPLLTAGGLTALSASLASGFLWLALVGACLLAAALVVSRRTIPWSHALAFLLVVVLFVPIRRYGFPGGMPFQPEPYRVIVGVLILFWVVSLLVDRRVRLRSTGLEAPLLAIVVTALLSIVANPARVALFEGRIVKALTFFLSFLLVFYLVATAVRGKAAIDLLIKTLVVGGAVIAVLAAVESRTGRTPFTGLDSFLPFLEPLPGLDVGIQRGARLRALGPAEHPIALSAALVLLVPLAFYLTRTASRRWWLPLGALVVGVLSTVSRTGVVMLLVVGVVFLWLRPRETKRLWPALIPLLVVAQILLPGTLGTLKSSFFPEGGLVESQRALAGDCASSGRIADLGPSLSEASRKPFFGYGYATRVVEGPNPNACILDNQWLATLLEVGAFGFLAWVWLCVRAVRRFGRQAREDPSPEGWLPAAVAASVAAFAVGLCTFDGLSFIQVTFLFFVILGIGAAQALPARQRRLSLVAVPPVTSPGA